MKKSIKKKPKRKVIKKEKSDYLSLDIRRSPFDRVEEDLKYRRVPSPSESILNEAATIIKGQRREDYGPVSESFEAIAKTWSAVLKVDITSYQVALCMIGLKVCRASNKKTRDSLVDVAGYAALAEDL